MKSSRAIIVGLGIGIGAAFFASIFMKYCSKTGSERYLEIRDKLEASDVEALYNEARLAFKNYYAGDRYPVPQSLKVLPEIAEIWGIHLLDTWEFGENKQLPVLLLRESNHRDLLVSVYIFDPDTKLSSTNDIVQGMDRVYDYVYISKLDSAVKTHSQQNNSNN